MRKKQAATTREMIPDMGRIIADVTPFLVPERVFCCDFDRFGINNHVAVKLILMTALNIATQIPPSINTLEGLVAWGIVTLNRVNPDSVVLETDTRAELACQSGLFQDADKKVRLLGRICLELDPDYGSNGKKIWANTREFPKGAAIPSGYST